MRVEDINNEVVHGNYQLQRVLREMVRLMHPSYIPGNIYVVFNTSDEAYVQYAKDWDDLYPDGTRVVQTSLSAAYSAATSNRHDVILINGHNTHTLTSMLSVSKNRLHFIGLGNQGVRFGQAAKVSLGVTTAATDIGTIQNTGVRNSFHNIKVLNSNTVTEGIYSFVEAGEYTLIEDCEIYKSTDLDQTGAAELVMNGDSSKVKNCYIGSTVNAISGAIIRPAVLMTRDIVSGKVSRDVVFENTIFARKCGNSANRFIYGANANDVERLAYFKECIFWNAALASATPAQNVAFGATQTDGSVLLHNCSSVGADTAMSTTTGVFVDSPVPTAGTSGISVQAS